MPKSAAVAVLLSFFLVPPALFARCPIPGNGTLEVIAPAGNLIIDIAQGDGENLVMRRIKTQTVIGEMGFFRQSTRAATVSADGPVTLYTLTRNNFEKMRRERPELANAFDDFILRILADRIEFANRQVASLSQ